jgi:hypothetical protein
MRGGHRKGQAKGKPEAQPSGEDTCNYSGPSALAEQSAGQTPPGKPERLNNSTLFGRHPLRVPLYRLAGSGLASGGIIVGVVPHEVGRPGDTAYWGCLDAAGLVPVAPSWALWMTGLWLLLHRASGGNHVQRTPKWLKLRGESSP